MNSIKNAFPGHPVESDITVIRNDTFKYKIRGWTRGGSPYDFTSHEFIMQVKDERQEGEDPVIDIPNTAFTITQDTIGSNAGVSNIVEIEYAADNMDIDPGDYVYDIQMTDGDGKIQTIQKEDNYFRVVQDVSQ